MNTLNSLVLGYAGALTSALVMLVMGILGNLGIYTKAVAWMVDMHLFFSLSIGGIIGGMIEAAVITFIILYVFGFIYNAFIAKK